MILCSDSFREFIRILAEDKIVKRVSSRAIASIAEELRIGRIELFMNVPQSRNLIDGQNEKLVLFDSPNGYSEDGCITVKKITGDRGEAVLNCFGTADGYAWNEEERQDLEIVNEILFLYGARFRLIGLLQKTALTQYMTGLPNSGGYLRKVGEIFSRGEAADYDAYYLNIKGMALLNVKYGQREGDEIIKRYS
ncbi:MAG: hypothetical protein IK096_06350, partial [Lachnospiraceae bacterium]|nr:hypothetical protein [Lachnospiraceae bacterium]